MMFWDASALIPLLIDETQTETVRAIAERDSAIAAWWGSTIECCSAFARLRREGFLKDEEEDSVRHLLSLLSGSWTEIEPGREIRNTAERLLLAHPLRAADALQLAAALVWARKDPKGFSFVCLDQRLRTAARNEGFTVLPAKAP
jgi:predicted nucleic acid-binding protein